MIDDSVYNTASLSRDIYFDYWRKEYDDDVIGTISPRNSSMQMWKVGKHVMMPIVLLFEI